MRTYGAPYYTSTVDTAWKSSSDKEHSAGLAVMVRELSVEYTLKVECESPYIAIILVW